MTATTHRSRSTTAVASRRSSQNNPRPVSRASTVSLQSRSNRASPVPRFDPSQLAQVAQSNAQSNGSPYANYDPQFSQGNGLDTSQHPDFAMDPNGMSHHSGMVQYDHNMGIHGLSNGQLQSFPPHFFDPNTFEEEDRTEQGSVEPEAKKKGKGGKSIDKQMEEHVEAYRNKDIAQIAQDVKRLEGSPESERPKLAFAIRWLQEYCRWAPKQNCPKNRVYRRYGERANIEGGVVLNPASFGKCVKFVFRDLQTRRLGVRGESKYHYVDLEIVPESEEYSGMDIQRMQSGRSTSQPNGAIEMPPLPAPVRPAGDTAPFPDQEPSFSTPYQDYENAPSQAQIFINPTKPQWHTKATTSQSYRQTLKLPEHMEFDPTNADDSPLDLPPVWRYAPSKTDTDAANTLQSLYFNHCSSVVDAVRFCKERNFFHLFTSLNGTMTVPTQKLYSHASMASWIKEADWTMYRRIADNVSRLALQAVPTPAIAFLDNVANKLHDHISKIFENHPIHVLEAKLEPASLFCNILKRMLRANQSAHAAAKLLVDDGTRDQMWYDMVKYVQPKKILESEVPLCGYEEVYKILTQDIRYILQPRNTSKLLEFGTHYQEAAQLAQSDLHYYTNNTPIERIADWLLQLPKRFPQTNARTILNCVSGVTGAILRELTFENAVSLNIWVVVKCFVDELSWYYAFHAGFCSHRVSEPSFDATQSFDANASFMDHNGDNLGLDTTDDSGIGMSLLDDIPTK